MAALTADVEITEQKGEIVSMPVVASDITYKGALCKINADGYLAPCAVEAGSKFAGIAFEQKDNSSGAAGAVECRVITKGNFLLTGAGLAQANVGDLVYASDDATATVTEAANLQIIGRIVKFVSATQVWVALGEEGTVLGA